MSEGSETKRIKAETKERLIEAYKLLNMAAHEYDLVDTLEAAHICKVRKDCLDLLTTRLSL